MQAALNNAQNRLQTAQKGATGHVQASRDALLTHLRIPAPNAGRRSACRRSPSCRATRSSTTVRRLPRPGKSSMSSRRRCVTSMPPRPRSADWQPPSGGGGGDNRQKLQADRDLLIAVQRRSFVGRASSSWTDRNARCSIGLGKRSVPPCALDGKTCEVEGSPGHPSAMTANARAVAQAAGGLAIPSLARSASPPGRGKRHSRRAWRLGRAVSTRFERLSGHWTADTLPRTHPTSEMKPGS